VSAVRPNPSAGATDVLADQVAGDLRAVLDGVSIVGVGVDAVDLERMRRVLARRPRLEERCFSPAERAHAHRMADPAPSLAARFAAKEAVMKALGVGLWRFGLRDVEIVRQPSGAPSLAISGRAATLASERGVSGWRCTLTHSDATAVAVAIALASKASCSPS
jgi:holo-[acyl-carrier protein] synthase